ncbi:MAG: phenylacetate--CoA ligase family protein [Deltaproteobacteria bacterium]|jgi:phenylacetate-CoA ligase|nr:phenylacetate--CoA ligase family protein [Deltaproteobacteria bacterium]
MGTLEVIKKFIESNWIIEKAAREVLERLPLRFRYGISYGPTFRYWLGFLKECEKWSRDRIEAYQIEQLKDLLIHAGKNVPYYRKVLGEYGFKPEKLQGLDDLKTLPYIDKEIVRDNIREFLADNIPRRTLFRKTTSGSTGSPLAIYSNKETEEKHWATVVYSWSKVGYSPKSRAVDFCPSTRKVKRYGNQLILSRYYFDDEFLQGKFVALIRNFEPELIFGIPSALFLFSNFMKKKKMPPFNGIRACISESEPLYPWQKEPIEEIFNARTFQTYGMVEKAIYASQCIRSSRYHIYPQYGIPEMTPARDGICEIVGTSFINYANPLIRYKTGDIGILNTQKCEGCNASHQSLDLIVGRIGSLLVGKNGALYSPLAVGIDSNVFENVKQFQFFQDSPGKVTLRIVKKESFTDADTDRIRKKIITDIGLQRVNNDMEITIVFEKDIYKSPFGKYIMVQQMLDVRNFVHVYKTTQ